MRRSGHSSIVVENLSPGANSRSTYLNTVQLPFNSNIPTLTTLLVNTKALPSYTLSTVRTSTQVLNVGTLLGSEASTDIIISSQTLPAQFATNGAHIFARHTPTSNIFHTSHSVPFLHNAAISYPGTLHVDNTFWVWPLAHTLIDTKRHETSFPKWSTRKRPQDPHPSPRT